MLASQGKRGDSEQNGRVAELDDLLYAGPTTDPEDDGIHRFRGSVGVADSQLKQFVVSDRFETIGGAVVLVNFFVMTIETHGTAMNDKNVIEVVKHLNRAFLLYYICELSARLYVLKKEYFHGFWNILDIAIVIVGVVGEIVELVVGSADSLASISMLKSLRMIRLIRLLRLLVAFRELYILLAGLFRCVKTLLWSCGLIFLTLNVWSILSVEYLRPHVDDLNEEGAFDSSPECQTAFSNIWYANLMWFKVMTGDGWSTCFGPLIERYYWPFLLVVCNIFFICFGLLNLIVAAIVDSSAQAREDDTKTAAKITKQHQEHTWNIFHELCSRMDEDNNGHISVDEFLAELRINPDLRSMLLVMGVEEQEIEGLFDIMDEDGNGSLDFGEFIRQFYEMRTHVVKTSVYYVLKYVQKLTSSHEKLVDELRNQGYSGLSAVTTKSKAAKMSQSSSSIEAPHASGAAAANAACSPTSASTSAVASAASPPSAAVAGSPASTTAGCPAAAGWYYYGPAPPVVLPSRTVLPDVSERSQMPGVPSAQAPRLGDGLDPTAPKAPPLGSWEPLPCAVPANVPSLSTTTYVVDCNASSAFVEVPGSANGDPSCIASTDFKNSPTATSIDVETIGKPSSDGNHASSSGQLQSRPAPSEAWQASTIS
eukprot:TRINITY_DN29230_c0_g2_i1.p1 TRINITY_DN29230_c0_g2~~TRINITY_DN29230_c0_g2_i1.p1  ORF type:complete len:653 (-),score=71.16 TRINITY_DN29230_c0_g2_i1:224-2182(-)